VVEDDGTGIGTVTFYEAAYIDTATWVQLGDPVPHTTTITAYAAGAGLLYVGEVPSASVNYHAGRVYQFELRDETSALVADVDFGYAEHGDVTLTDGEGLLWTASTAFTNRQARFTGEVSSWPVEYAAGGADSWCPIEVSGILRRLNLKPDPVVSAWRRYIEAQPGLQAYWPMEDPEDGAEFPEYSGAGSLEASPAVTVSAAEQFKCSGQLTTIGTCRLNGPIASYTSTGYVAVLMLVRFPAAGETINSEFFSLYTTGTMNRWQVEYDSGGAFQVYGYRGTGGGVAPTFASASWDLGIRNSPRLMMLELQQAGADVNISLRAGIIGQNDWAWDWSDTQAGYTVGAATSIEINSGGFINETYLGHVAVLSDEGSLYADVFEPLYAYRGERAAVRIERIAYEQGIDLITQGNVATSAEMGYQLPGASMDLMTECATTDGGTLHEGRSDLGLRYRTQGSIAAEDPTSVVPWRFILDGSSTDDDRDVGNHITATSPPGWSVVVQDAASIAEVGLYESATAVNVRWITQLLDIASWRLHFGTAVERRWPLVSFELARDPALTWWEQTVSEFLVMDVCDKILINELPAYAGYEDIHLLVDGFRESTDGYSYRFEIDAMPAEPWNIGRYGVARYGDGTSVLAAGVDDNDVALSVTTTELWTVDPTQVPFDISIGGERMTATAIAGAASPQDFTVTRSVNGVVKAHLAGAAITLADPAYYGM